MLTPAKHSENQATKSTSTNGSFFGGGGSAPFFQAKLAVNQPGDTHEREADAVADQVMRMQDGDASILQRMPLPPVDGVMRKCGGCEEKEKEGVQRKETGGGDASGKAAPSVVSDVLSSGGGQPMDGSTLRFMESHMGQDFSQVRIHTDSRAAESASAIQARAYTSGRDVVFGSGEYQPGSEGGRRLLAHELVHVGQQGAGRNPSKISRTLTVSDVRSEMVGQKFTLIKPWLNEPIGTPITITDWDGSNPDVKAEFIGAASKKLMSGKFPKRLIEPAYTAISGMSKYQLGLSGQRTAIENEMSKVTALEAVPKRTKIQEAELARLKVSADKKQTVMGDMLVYQTMFNRFESSIKKWVDFYQKQFSKKITEKLDYNVVKSMAFEESRMGTYGKHLELPPYDFNDAQKHPIRSRFNIIQASDSWAPLQYLMIKENAPTIYAKYNLVRLENKAAWKGLLDGPDIDTFEKSDYLTAVKEHLETKNSTGKMNYQDFDFWVQSAVRWLYEKRLHVSSWKEAVRAFNGAGPNARKYRDDVYTRVPTKSSTTQTFKYSDL